MRHRRISGNLGRTSSHRRAMFRNLVTSLLEHERIQTTDAKAKQVRRIADRMITLGKRGTLHARRRALQVVRSRDVTGKLFAELAERYRERPGGYTRVIKLGARVGDAAPVSVVELVEGGPPKPTAEGGKRKRPARKTTSKKAAAKETTSEKTTAKKTAPKKATSKKTASKKTASKKTASKKATSKGRGSSKGS